MRRGYDLILVARRAERLQAIAAEMSCGAVAEVLPADLTSDEDLVRVADRIRGCDRLTLLVNNAGFGVDALFHKSALGRQSAMARLHVLAPTHLTHAALPGMVVRGRSGHQCVVCGGLSSRVGQRDVLRDEGVPQQFLRQLISRLDRHRRARAGVVPRIHLHRVSRCHGHEP